MSVAHPSVADSTQPETMTEKIVAVSFLPWLHSGSSVQNTESDVFQLLVGL